MSYTAAVITVSDKGHQGLRSDTSGPNLCQLLAEKGFSVVYTAIVPDDAEQIRTELLRCTDELGAALVLTTGGTGFSPRDVTPEAVLPLLDRQTPGIPEAMRAESMRITPKGCLSRSVAGIRKRTLIITLPGSKKAAEENLMAVLDPVCHGLEMLLGEGSADCAVEKKSVPSMDAWLREAKAHESAPMIGMYLTHNGVVRRTAKAVVRKGEERAPVSGMRFSYDQAKVDAVIADTGKMEGVFYIRVWLNEGELNVGDDLMYVLIGGDIRPRVIAAMEYLVGRLKNECVQEKERFES